MNDTDFADVMNGIGAQADAERLDALEAQRRRRLVAKGRGGIACFLWGALVACGLFYRSELQQFVSEEFLGSKPQGGQRSGVVLKRIQEDANQRDEVVNEITR